MKQSFNLPDPAFDEGPARSLQWAQELDFSQPPPFRRSNAPATAAKTGIADPYGSQSPPKPMALESSRAENEVQHQITLIAAARCDRRKPDRYERQWKYQRSGSAADDHERLVRPLFGEWKAFYRP
jgi:hypothetical protein